MQYSLPENLLTDPDWTSLQDTVGAVVALERDQRVPKKPHDFMTVPLPYLTNDPKFVAFCVLHKVVPIYAMGFWCEPHSRGLIHKDIDDWAFNFPLSVAGGRQVWVDVDAEPTLTHYGNTNSRPFEIYPADTPFVERGSLILDRPCFVRTDILHYVDNSDNPNVRYSLTVRFKGPNPFLTDGTTSRSM